MLLIACVLLFVAGFYSYHDYKNTEEYIKNAMIAECDQMSQLISASAGDSYREIEDYGVKKFCKDSELVSIVDYHQELITNLADVDGNENGLILEVYFVDRKGNIYTYLDSRNALPAGVPVYLDDKLKKELEEVGEHHNYTYYGTAETSLTNYSYIYDSKGEVSAILTANCLLGELKHILWQNTLNMFLTLSCILIAAYVFLKMMETFVGDLRRMRSRGPEESDKKRTDMCGLYVFLETIIFSADSVILVYVAKSLCEGMPAGMQAAMVALPMTSYAAGALLGKFMYTLIAKWLGDRKTAIVSTVGLMVFSGVLMLAIRLCSIWIFIIGKFFMGILLGGFVINLVEMIPLASSDRKVQKEAINASVKSAISASILSVLLCGYLSTVLSYGAMYLMGGIVSVLLLAVSIVVFKGKKKDDDSEEIKEKMSIRSSWAVFRKKPMLMYIFLFTMPSMLIGGYNSYLYPMYTAGAGISAMLLSKIAVFSNTVTFGLNDIIVRTTEKIDDKKLLIIPKLVICAGLVCFILSPNVYWAIFIFFLYGIVDRMTRVSAKMYLVNVSNEYNTDKKAVQSNNMVITSIFDIIRSPVSSGFVALGMNLACTAVGLIAGGLYSVFGVYLKNVKNKTDLSSSPQD